MSAPDDSAVFEEAAKWWMQRHSADAEARAAFALWLAADPRHGEAFDAVAAAWDETGVDDGIAQIDEDAADEDAAGVTRLVDTRQARLRRRTLVRRALIGTAIAASIAGYLICVGLSTKQVSDYATGHDQHLKTELADGSMVELDANSRVHVEYTAGRRSVTLLNGRVLFDVAHNAHRPFTVTTKNGVVTVLGTLFSVEYRDAGTSVELFRGHVQAGPLAQPSAIDLQPGDAVRIGGQTSVELSHNIDAEKALLWRQGRLVFDNDTLEHVVARMNDYGDAHITIRDAAAAHLAISGVFQAGQNKAFLNALQTYYGLDVKRNGQSVIIGSRPKAS
jgi:transmembrane sensor